jgi:hypothetical protein
LESAGAAPGIELLCLLDFVLMYPEFPGTNMVKEYEGDHEFEEVEKLDKSFRSLAGHAKTTDFVQIANAFARSMERVASLAALPVELIVWCQAFAQVACIARYEIGLSPRDQSRDDSPEFKDQLQKVFAQLDKAKITATAWHVGGHNLKQIAHTEILQSNPEHVVAGIEAALAAMLTTSYAAFETMAADLWVAALNRHVELADKFIERNRDKKLELPVLSGFKYDMSRSMGRVLVENRKVSFQSFNSLSEAYRNAFREIVDPVFSHPQEIYQTEQIRHLLAHRGGLIDSKFKDEMKDFDPYKDVSVGTYLRLDGPMVRRHIDACVRAGIALFSLVDDWSAKPPPRGA